MIGKKKKDTQKTTRIIPVLAVGLLSAILLAALSFVYVSKREAYDEQYLLRTSEQQVLAQQIAKYALEASGGDEHAFGKLKTTRDRFSQLMSELKDGATDVGLPGSPDEVSERLRAVENSWLELSAYVDEILLNKSAILTIDEFVHVVTGLVPRLEEASDVVVKILVKDQAPQSQVYVAARQLMLARRIDNSINRVLKGGTATASAIDQFGSDASLFDRVLKGMLKGDNSLKITKITNAQGVKTLRAMSLIFSTINDHAQELVELGSKILPALEATGELTPASDKLNQVTKELMLAYRDAPGRLQLGGVKIGPATVVIFSVLSAVLLVLLALAILYNSRRHEKFSVELNKRNQDAIRRLLDEMGDLADGDLTVETTVSEDITGAIADSINFSIEAMRGLVETINDASVRVTSSAQETRSTAMHLADATEHQKVQISTASQTVRDISQAISDMAGDAGKSIEVAQTSVEIANRGGEVVRQTIEGMDDLRDQIQETAKRMKRLGESSQEIGNIVELIEDIADQTNILALNASMQAAMAGEAGRGFAVVADEVQRLAERSSNATKQIEALVKTIQTDTQEVISSMESSTSEVVSGAKLAEDAGEALKEIVGVSGDIANIIQNFAETAEKQSQEVGAINDTMNVIQEITNQTSEGTNHTAESVGTLVDMADQLRETVAGFKLPDND